MCLLASGSAAAGSVNSLSQLRVTPSEGHAGGLIDLSGSGFPARTHLNVLMACPSWQAENAVRLGNVVIMSGPTSNARGQFSGFLFRAIRLHGIPFSACQIQASVGDNPFGVDIPAVYFIQQSGKGLNLNHCQQHLCVQRLQVQPHEVRSGYDETISLHTWPGATVTTTYTYPGNRQTVDYHVADWTGAARWTKRIVGQTATGAVEVRASAALGPMSGVKTAKFTIVH
jgi:hypothetical protein